MDSSDFMIGRGIKSVSIFCGGFFGASISFGYGNDGYYWIGFYYSIGLYWLIGGCGYSGT